MTAISRTAALAAAFLPACAAASDLWEIHLQGPDSAGLVIQYDDSAAQIVPPGICGVRLTGVSTHAWREVSPFEPSYGDLVLPGQSGTPSGAAPSEITVAGIPHLPGCGDVSTDTAEVRIGNAEVAWVDLGLGYLSAQASGWDWLLADGSVKPRGAACDGGCAASGGLVSNEPVVPGGVHAAIQVRLSAEILREELGARGKVEGRGDDRLIQAASGLGVHLGDLLLGEAVRGALTGAEDDGTVRLSTALAGAEACRAAVTSGRGAGAGDDACAAAVKQTAAALEPYTRPMDSPNSP